MALISLERYVIPRGTFHLRKEINGEYFLNPSEPIAHSSLRSYIPCRLEIVRNGFSSYYHKMTISDQQRVTHIVLFKYNATVPWTDLEHHFTQLAKLKSTCLKPAGSGKPYMLSMQIGKNHSWENFAKGMTHCIVLEFASLEDRDFYLLEDPVHRAFSVTAAPLIEGSVVVGKTAWCLASMQNSSLTWCCNLDFVNGVLLGSSPQAQSQNESYKAYPGSCQCEAVAFHIRLPTGIPPTHIICHCSVCKKISGAPYTCNYIIPIADFTVSRGSERLKVYEYQGASGRNVSCYYCENCTSHIYHVQQRDPNSAIIRTLLLESGNAMGASGEIFSEGALGWARDLRSTLPA
jgi:hypothetical protein